MAHIDLASQFPSRFAAYLPQRRDRTPYNPWLRGMAWLLGLGLLFMVSHHYSTMAPAAKDVGPGLVWAWERAIPVLPWSVLPYLSIGLLGATSLLASRSARATDRHGLRLLTALLIAVASLSVRTPGTCNLLDQPVPALPVAVLVLVRAQFGTLQPARVWRFLLDAWTLLVAASVLTSGQLHLIGLISGAALGLLCLWLWPNLPIRSPLRRERLAPHVRAPRARMALLALSGAVLTASLAWSAGFGSTMLLLGWVALALGLVAWNYAWCGASGFQQNSKGRQTTAASWLLAPYTLVARLSAWVSGWGRRAPLLIASNVWLGPLPGAAELRRPPEGVPVFRTLCTLSAELVAPPANARPDGAALKIVARPWLDLVPASGQELVDAAHEIDHLRRSGPLLVAGGRGFERSAAVLATWLHMHGQAPDTASAAEHLQALRPDLKLDAGWRAALAQAETLMHTGATMPAPLNSLPMPL